MIDLNGHVVAVGAAPLDAERGFQVDLENRLLPGTYALSALIAVNGNVMNAELHRMEIVIPVQR